MAPYIQRLFRGYRSYSDYDSVRRLYFFAGAMALVALGLSIAAGMLGTHVNPDVNAGMIIRRVAAGVYGVRDRFGR